MYPWAQLIRSSISAGLITKPSSLTKCCSAQILVVHTKSYDPHTFASHGDLTLFHACSSASGPGDLCNNADLCDVLRHADAGYVGRGHGLCRMGRGGADDGGVAARLGGRERRGFALRGAPRRLRQPMSCPGDALVE